MSKALDEAIARALPQGHPHPDLNDFYRLIGDYPARGGKRLRGQLVLRSVDAHGGDWRVAVEVAAALELFQNWVLIHDDIEDDSEDRRGTPTLHRQVGMPVALNVGDALHVYMWGLLHGVTSLSLERWREMLAEFSFMIHRTAEGQHLDLCWIGQERFDISERDYLEMVTLKTAYYTVLCPLRLGAICAGYGPLPVLEGPCLDLGVAFQIRDDVLNLLPKSAAYGKEFAGDLYEAKRTLILAHFFAAAPSAQRDEVLEILRKPRLQKTEGEIARVLHLLKQHGSLAYAQRVAEERAKRGLNGLAEALAPLENRVGVQALKGMLESLASRQS